MTSTAAIYRGDKRFSVERIEPMPPGPGEVQIDVAYCGICGTDLHIYLGHMDALGAFQQTWTVPAHTTHVLPEGPDQVEAAFKALTETPNAMKSMIRMREEA